MGSPGAVKACESLKEMGLGDRLLYPHETRYDELVTPHWSRAAQLTPHCVVQPRTTEEVSKAVSVLAKAEGSIFAVRSGGHCLWPGASNCEGGIVIDLGQMNKTTFDADRNVVAVQAGSRWKDVYQEAESHGVTVNGGRLGDVGVGGFLCGGGFSWLLPRYGFGCDTVINYEVVLADGRIIQVNKHEYADLFVALKGGACNFGIVTRFDLEAIEGAQVWGGIFICHKSTTPQHIEYFVDYIDTIEDKTDTSYALIWSWNSTFKDVVMMLMMSNTKGVANPPAVSKIVEVPSLVNTLSVRGVTDLALHLQTADPYHNKWLTATFKNDPRILSKAAELHEEFVAKLRLRIPDDGFGTICFAQALPTLYAKRSEERGGNVLGVERLGENCVSVLTCGHIKEREHMEYGFAVLQEWYDSLVEYGRSIGVWKDWLYLNYADKSQNPLRTFGEENIEKIRAAAVKYDPEGIFQTKCPGGFKITRI